MEIKKYIKKIIIAILVWESKLVLKKYKPKIIAITGSVGKTSTKDAIFTVLSKFENVRKNNNYFNSDLGIPFTIIGLSNSMSGFLDWIENILIGLKLLIFKNVYPNYLILEIGVNRPGDIKNIAKWLRPDIVVITRFPEKPVHVEFFKSADELIEEKCCLAYSLKKDGLLILNHDDKRVYDLHEKVKRKMVSYGENEDATYRFLYPTYLEENGKIYGINFKLLYDGNTFPVNLPKVCGKQYIYSAIVAILCANELGFDLLSSISHVSDFINPPGRLNLLKGINNSSILDDTYNSSPVALELALSVLNDLKAKRKIAVIGDMLELGKYTEEEHRKVGNILVNIVDVLITVGPRSKYIAEEALKNKFKSKNIFSFDSYVDTSEFLKNLVKEGDLILIKGSQKLRLEKVVESILLNKEFKKDILCRQEKEWIDK